MNIAKATRQETQLAGNVKVAFNNGSKGRLRSTVRDYVNSYSARLVAAAEAVDSCKRKTHKDVLQIAREMNVWRFCYERVDVNLALKIKHGKFMFETYSKRCGVHRKHNPCLTAAELELHVWFRISMPKAINTL